MKMSPLSKHRSIPLDTMRKAHCNFSPSGNLSPLQCKYTTYRLYPFINSVFLFVCVFIMFYMFIVVFL